MEWAVTAPASPSKPHAPSLAPHRYRNRAAASMLLLRGQGAADVGVSEFTDATWHAPWAADPLVVADNPQRFGGCQMSATLLAADQVRVCTVCVSVQRERSG